MNTESINCRRVKFGEDASNGGMEKPGDFTFDEDFLFIYVWLPGGTGPDAFRIQKGLAAGPRVWGWDGNEDKPTLTPSIHWLDHWHGHLTAGRLVSC